jgi:hypothetical protein
LHHKSRDRSSIGEVVTKVYTSRFTRPRVFVVWAERPGRYNHRTTPSDLQGSGTANSGPTEDIPRTASGQKKTPRPNYHFRLIEQNGTWYARDTNAGIVIQIQVQLLPAL